MPHAAARWFRPALAAILLLAGGLRFAGIGHGLDTGFIAHPDTPKQVDAIERFLKGERYWKIGYSDYDGYPLFASRLTALVIATGTAVVNPVREALDREPWPRVPEKLDRFHALRCVNATLAALAVLAAGWGGRVLFGPAAGLLGALLLALSPADIAAAHYASGDTAAAAFGLLAMLLSARLVRDGRRVDALLAGFAAALAFAAKYHALVAFAAAGVAVLMRAGPPRCWLRRPALIHAGLVAAGGLAGLWFAIPGLREAPMAMIADIRYFIGYAANFGLPEELEGAGFFGKLVYSLRHNLPVLAALLSLPVVLVLPAALVRVRREPWIAVLLVGPLLYFVMGVSLRPAAHPVYHTILTGPVLVVAAAAMVRLPRLLAVPLALASIGLLAHGGYREVYFFTHPDIRTVMPAWMQENVPAAYGYYHHRYAFQSAMHTGVAWSAHGTVRVSPSLRPVTPSEHFATWFTAGVERDALPVFRNPAIEFQLRVHSSVEPGGFMPVFQRIPSTATAPWILADLPEFYRTGRVGIAHPDETVRRTVVSAAALSNLVVTLVAGGDPARVSVVLGGRRISMRLDAHGSTHQVIPRPLARAPWGTGWHHYNLEVRARGGAVRWAVAFTDEQRASDLRQAGFGREADVVWRQVEAGRAGRVFASPLHDQDPLFPTFGIARSYLTALPYLAWSVGGGSSWTSEPLWLEPGWYRAQVTLDREVANAVPINILFADGRGSTALANALMPRDGRELVIRHWVNMGLRGGTMTVTINDPAAGMVSVALRPDPVAAIHDDARRRSEKEAENETH